LPQGNANQKGALTAMDRILQMIIRQVVGRVVNIGINAGVNRVTRGSTREADMTPEQRAQVSESQGQNRSIMRMARRFTRL
jgi:hypothetical protein